jgi:hypothetical protein
VAPARTSQADGPQFTSERLREVLRNKLGERATLPNVHKLKQLADMLNGWSTLIRLWREPLPREIDGSRQVKEAIRVLVEDYSQQRERYVAEVKLASQLDENLPLSLREAFRRARLVQVPHPDPCTQLAAFDSLIAAARVACKLGLPMVSRVAIGTPISDWRDIAHLLQGLLLQTLPGKPVKGLKEGIYRSIAALIPDLTGEHPTRDDIKQELLSYPAGRPLKSVDQVVDAWRNNRKNRADRFSRSGR